MPRSKYASANEYQRAALRTRGEFKSFHDLLAFSALEMTAEAGEVANIVYKVVYQGHPLTDDVREKLIGELGDVLWGIASMCSALGIGLSLPMDANIAKLKKRYPDGFTTAHSIARVDTLQKEVETLQD